MKISFDLDATLFVSDPALAGPEMYNYVEPYKVDRLRAGAPELLRRLGEEGWEIWIYTNSLRPRKALLVWSMHLGMPVKDVINQQIHENACAERGVLPVEVAPKMPHWFGIDLHVDNSEQIAAAGRAGGFEVCCIASDDPEWAAKVRACAEEVQRGGQ